MKHVFHTEYYFTLLELLIAIGIIALLAGGTVAGISGTLKKARQIQCVGNLRQLGVSFNAYIQDNKSYYPNAFSLPSAAVELGSSVTASVADLLLPYANKTKRGEGIFRCPEDKDQANKKSYAVTEGSSYEYNSKLAGYKTGRQSEEKVHSVSKIPALFDYECFHGTPNSKKAKNYLYADGHVDEMK